MGIESLSAIEAILIALSGVATVFMMLGCLCLLIIVISKVVVFIEKKPESKAQPVIVATSEEKENVKEEKVHTDLTYGDEIMLIDVDEKTAACIMAIVSHETGISLNELVFKKIRAL